MKRGLGQRQRLEVDHKFHKRLYVPLNPHLALLRGRVRCQGIHDTSRKH